ncbi:DKNYY domain-containing protein [Fluviicola sp.]|uniref:DKNYY domain-containing protein n=1 Tax=Fluviicola sp. TaxID=1917219 RepID=UPI003D2DCF24
MKRFIIYLLPALLGAFYSLGQSSISVEPDLVNWKNQKQCFETIQKYHVDTIKWESIKLNFYKNITDGKFYYLTCEADSGPVFYPLIDTIDFNSYIVYGEYAVDKHSVFYFNSVSEGIKITKLDACDRLTFKIFGSTQYAKDKRFIYWNGQIIKNADLESFSVIDFNPDHFSPPLAMDKNHIYLWDQVLTDTSEIEGLERFLRSKTGLEIYNSIFGCSQTDCVQVLNYKDQIDFWLYVETCPRELDRILSKYPFRFDEPLSSEDWDGNVPGADSLNWFTPMILGTDIMVYEFSPDDSKDILTIWSNMDKTKIFIRKFHTKIK